MKIPDIFSTLGEPRFREVESRELVNASLRHKAVIALGGGAYLNAENRAIAEATGLTVWLKADLASIYQRVKIDGSRPLFSDNERAERLYRDRMPFYEMARLHVNTEDSSPEEVAAEIIGKMEKLK